MNHIHNSTNRISLVLSEETKLVDEAFEVLFDSLMETWSLLTISVDTLIFCHTHFTGIDEDEESLCTLVRQEQIVKIQKKIYFLSILVVKIDKKQKVVKRFQPRFFLVESEVEPCPRNSKNTAWREVRWKAAGKTMLQWTIAGFLCGDRQRRCFPVDC